MLGCGFVIALILAWPTMGASIFVWLAVVVFSIHRDRKLNEIRDLRRVEPSRNSGPRRHVIDHSIKSTLEQISYLPRDQAAALFHELDVTYDGEPIDNEVAAGCLREAARYGVQNVDLLIDHMMRIATVARQRKITRSDEQAGLRSILCWCIENASRNNRDSFLSIDIARTSRNGAKADRQMLG